MVLSHCNCQPPSFFMLPPALTHAQVLTHKHAQLIYFYLIAIFSMQNVNKSTTTKKKSTICSGVILFFVFALQYQMCSVHAAGGSTLTSAHSLSSAEQQSAVEGRDLVSAPHSSLILPLLHPCGLPLYMTSEPFDSHAQLWPEQSWATPMVLPIFNMVDYGTTLTELYPQRTTQSTGILSQLRDLNSLILI